MSGCVKHYVFNNEEDDRSGMSANVGNRAAKELYYKPFAAAVDAGVGSAMCSYNRVNRTWACEEQNALDEIHNVMGFAGWMMSDWGATQFVRCAEHPGARARARARAHVTTRRSEPDPLALPLRAAPRSPRPTTASTSRCPTTASSARRSWRRSRPAP